MANKNTNILTDQPTQSTQSTTKRSLLDFYTTGVALSKLKEAPYKAHLISHQFITGASTPEGESKSYIRLELQLEDRMIVDNRFEAGFAIFLDQIKEQLGKSDENIPVADLLNELVQSKMLFTIWVSYHTEDNRTFRNINYIAPKVAAPATLSSEEKF